MKPTSEKGTFCEACGWTMPLTGKPAYFVFLRIKIKNIALRLVFLG